MTDKRREDLLREAADIFLRLRENPDNPELQQQRDAFCARGLEEKQIYDDLLKTWKASGVMKAPRSLKSLVIAAALVGASYLAYEPARIAFLSDHATRSAPQQSMLASGDSAFLDAASALADTSDSETRRFELLDGAAFFDVETHERPFTVEVAGVTVTVVGTAFETALIDDNVLVSVAEGIVNVRMGDSVWTLTAGQEFLWSPKTGVALTERSRDDIATWRTDRLVVDGMTLGEAADIIQRRLNGPVLFTNATLRNTRVSGNLDLSKPLAALRILAETGGGRVYEAAGLGRVIAPK